MIKLTREQAEALKAFLDAFDLHTTGIWSTIEEAMVEMGIDDPETALEDARNALSQ